jgi:hypothetical protein
MDSKQSAPITFYVYIILGVIIFIVGITTKLWGFLIAGIVFVIVGLVGILTNRRRSA